MVWQSPNLSLSCRLLHWNWGYHAICQCQWNNPEQNKTQQTVCIFYGIYGMAWEFSGKPFWRSVNMTRYVTLSPGRHSPSEIHHVIDSCPGRYDMFPAILRFVKRDGIRISVTCPEQQTKLSYVVFDKQWYGISYEFKRKKNRSIKQKYKTLSAT